jgi:hypothetical protein
VKPIPASEFREVFADNGSMCSEVVKNLDLVSKNLTETK